MNAPSPAARPPNNTPSFKLNINRGVVAGPPRIVIYGGPGIGKTTLAASAPSPVFLDLEHGTQQLDAARIEGVETWEQMLAAVRALSIEEHPFKTLVIDTLDRAEWMCWQSLCQRERVDGIEKVGRGYGKGYVAAYEQFRVLARDLEALRARRGMAVVLTAHAKIEKAPQLSGSGDDYDRWNLKVDKRVAGLFYEMFDAVLYARLETYTQRNEAGRARGYGDARKLECQESPAWVAKNRFGLPRQMNLAWGELADAMGRGAGVVAASLRVEVTTALARLESLDPDTAAKAREIASVTPDDPQHLSPLLNRIAAAIAAREAAPSSDNASSDNA